VKRRLVRSAVAALAAATVALVLSLVVGRASSLTAGSQSLGANSATVSKCDSDGFTVTETVVGTATTVTGVTVAGVAAACAGQTLSAAVNNGTTSSTGSATVPAGGGTVNITLAAAVTGTAGMEIDVAIGG
jgi:hypothetical protein